MILPIHIAIALLSVIFSTYSIFAPSQLKLKLNYLLIVGTLISGTALVFETHADLGHACLSGLAYVGLVTMNIALTKRKLASLSSH